MLEILKKATFKKVFLRAGIALGIMLAFAAVTEFKVFQVISGPVKLAAEMDYSDYEGKYVSYQVRGFLNEYARISTRNSDSNVSRLTEIGYVAYDIENGSFLGIIMPASRETEMDAFIDESLDYFLGYSEDEPVSFTVKGTLRGITGSELRYYNETLEDFFEGYPEYLEYVLPYTIEEGYISGTDVVSIYMMALFMAAAFLYILYGFVIYFSGKYLKHLNRYLDDYPSYSLDQMEEDFNAAEAVGKGTWISLDWTLYFDGIFPRVLEHHDLVWAYYYRRTGKYSQSMVKTFNRNKKMVGVHLPYEEAMQLLENYEATQPHIVLGYDKALDKLFKKDFDQFLKIKDDLPVEG